MDPVEAGQFEDCSQRRLHALDGFLVVAAGMEFGNLDDAPRSDAARRSGCGEVTTVTVWPLAVSARTPAAAMFSAPPTNGG